MAGKEHLRQKTNEIIATKSGVDKVSSEQLDSVFEAIVALLADPASGGNVQIQKFGTFQRQVLAPRVARNPQNGTAIPVPGKVKMKFSSLAGFFTPTDAESKSFEGK